jgi:hypothetical protein
LRDILFWKEKKYHFATRHPDMRVKHYAYGHSVATLLNPLGVTTVSHKYSLPLARHATVVVAILLIIK